MKCSWVKKANRKLLLSTWQLTERIAICQKHFDPLTHVAYGVNSQTHYKGKMEETGTLELKLDLKSKERET